MYIEELFIIIVIVVGIYLYRNFKGENAGKYIFGEIQNVYERFAPYSFRVVREKTKQLGQNALEFYKSKNITWQNVVNKLMENEMGSFSMPGLF